MILNKGFQSVNRTKFSSRNQIRRFTRKIKRWQMQRYLNEGFTLNGFLFLLDVLVFLLYYKPKYDLELNQIYRWNVQKYKLNEL